MKKTTKDLIGIYMTSVMTFGQSSHYIQAYRIFIRQSVSDISLLSYTICFILILHAFAYSILIKNKLLMVAQGVGLIGSGIVIVEIISLI